jgi:DnaK suppressor protein
MSQYDFGPYKQRLLTKEQELVDAIARTTLDGRTSGDDDTQDLADKANTCYTKESLFQRSSYDRSLLTLVQGALRRTDAGIYGNCVECGQPVEKKRLQAVPWARHCVRCQELQEKGLL